MWDLATLQWLNRERERKLLLQRMREYPEDYFLPETVNDTVTVDEYQPTFE